MNYAQRSISTALILLTFATLIGACGTSASAPLAPQASASPTAIETSVELTSSQKPVVVLQSVDIETLDPMFGGRQPTTNILNHIFQSLTTQDIQNNIVPSLATAWQILEDKPTTWQFTLNPHARFSDGHPVTSKDVVFTWKRSTAPENQVASNYILARLKIMRVVNMQAVDDWTVLIETEEPSFALPGLLTEFFILPKHYYDGLALDIASRLPLGSGPYLAKEWVKDDHVTLVRSENYWQSLPSIKEIVWRPVPDAATRMAELLSGNADITVNLSPDKLTEVDAAEEVHTERIITGRRIYIGMTQYSHPALRDRRVRQAFNYAVDFDAINKGLLQATAKRVGTNVNPPWQNSAVEAYPHDPAKARELLAEAGYIDTDNNGFVDKDGEELKLTLGTTEGRYTKDKEIAQAVGQNLRDVGVNVEVLTQEPNSFSEKLLNNKGDNLFLVGASSNFEGQADLAFLEANSRSNQGRWSNNHFQELYAQLRGELDTARRAELLNELQVLIREEAPQIFLYFQVACYGVNDRLAVWQPYPNDWIHLEQVDIQ